MIYSETIEIVHSELMTFGIFSEEEPDYRVLEKNIRLTEDNIRRETEQDNLRLTE